MRLLSAVPFAALALGLLLAWLNFLLTARWAGIEIKAKARAKT